MGAMASQITGLTIVLKIDSLLRHRIKKIKLSVTDICEGNSPVTGEFPAQRVNNTENVCIWGCSLGLVTFPNEFSGNCDFADGVSIAANMMTSSNGKSFRVTGHLSGNSPVPGEFPAQRPVMQGFDVFFDLRPDKRLSKQSWGWWLETPSHSLWRHRNAEMICQKTHLGECSASGQVSAMCFLWSPQYIGACL